jgi:hypothetical protein
MRVFMFAVSAAPFRLMGIDVWRMEYSRITGQETCSAALNGESRNAFVAGTRSQRLHERPSQVDKQTRNLPDRRAYP